MSIQALQQLRDSNIQLFQRIAALEGEVADLKRIVSTLRPTVSLPAKSQQLKVPA